VSRLRWWPSLSGPGPDGRCRCGVLRSTPGAAHSCRRAHRAGKSNRMLSSSTSPIRSTASHPLRAERQARRQVLQNPAPGQVPMCSRGTERNFCLQPGLTREKHEYSNSSSAARFCRPRSALIPAVTARYEVTVSANIRSRGGCPRATTTYSVASSRSPTGPLPY